MSIAQELLAEFETQIAPTRAYLERIPADRLTWKPHAKSLTAGQLGYHIATVPGGVVRGAEQNQVPPPNFQFPQPESVEQILKTFDESIAIVREVLPRFDDAAMHATWRVMDGDKELVAMPRQAFLRNIMLNHWYQHRGQLSVYLRLFDVAVPSSWGPSADERAAFESAAK